MSELPGENGGGVNEDRVRAVGRIFAEEQAKADKARQAEFLASLTRPGKAPRWMWITSLIGFAIVALVVYLACASAMQH